MDPALFFYLSSSESDEDEKIVRRQLREQSNPLALPNKAFLKRFGLNKEAFKYVLQNISLTQFDAKAVSPVLKLAATLSLLASGGYQQSVGSDYLVGMCQSTVSKLTSHVLNEMEAKLCPQFIQFAPEDSLSCKEWFVEQYKIPGVVGCVGSTHIGLQRPKEDGNMYLNKKGYHSINAMIICDHTHKILAINCQYGGAALDSFVWKNSDQRRVFDERFQHNRQESSWLLGDFGYPLEPWCITPYRNAAEGSSEATFNDAHAKARCILKRSIGILKGRWKILEYGKSGRYHPTKVARFANVCAALHNICIKFQIHYHPHNYESDHIPEDDTDEENQLTTIGLKRRDQIKHSLLRVT